MAKCNLGKVNLDAMLASGFCPQVVRGGGPWPFARAPRDPYTQSLACSLWQRVIRSVVSLACTCSLLLPSPPSLGLWLDRVSCLVGKYSTEGFSLSVTVPWWWWPLAGLPWIPLTVLCVSRLHQPLGTNAQAHLLVMSLII